MCSCPLLTLSQLLVVWFFVTDEYVTVFQEWILVVGWQNRIIGMNVRGSLLHNSAPCCSAVAEIARSLPSFLVYSHSPDCCICLLLTTRCVCVLPWAVSKTFCWIFFFVVALQPSFPWPFSVVWSQLLFWLFISKEGTVTASRSSKHKVRHHRD